MARLKDVAGKAGVSIGTASKILRGVEAAQGFSADCVRRVQEAARELGYRPNYIARSLQTGRSHAVGMVLGGYAEGRWDHFWAGIISGVVGRALALGYHFVAVGEMEGLSPLDAGLRFMHERRVDALIVPGFAIGAGIPDELREAEGPIVLTSYGHETDLPVVDLDDAVGIVAAVEHLHGLGHRRLLWVGPGGDEAGPPERRRRAFHETVARHVSVAGELLLGPPRRPWLGIEDEVAGARDGLLGLARDGLDYTGIVCYDERIAFGLYAALAELGLHIPDDVSVIGFDDIHARVACPPMTVVSHMLAEMGAQAAELAIRMAEQGGPMAQWLGHGERVPAQLIVRESTGPAPR